MSRPSRCNTSNRESPRAIGGSCAISSSGRSKSNAATSITSHPAYASYRTLGRVHILMDLRSPVHGCTAPKLSGEWRDACSRVGVYDTVIVGGGPAGLSAALVLGRCRRLVLVCDVGVPRNARSLGLHCF